MKVQAVAWRHRERSGWTLVHFAAPSLHGGLVPRTLCGRDPAGHHRRHEGGHALAGPRRWCYRCIRTAKAMGHRMEPPPAAGEVQYALQAGRAVKPHQHTQEAT